MLDLRPGEQNTYDWLLHLPEKTWLDKDDVINLNDAFKFAAKTYKGGFDESTYNRTLKEQEIILAKKKSHDI